MLNTPQASLIYEMFELIKEQIQKQGGDAHAMETCFQPISFNIDVLKHIDGSMINAFLQFAHLSPQEKQRWEWLQQANQNNQWENEEWIAGWKNLPHITNPFCLANLCLFIKQLTMAPFEQASPDLKQWMIFLREFYLELGAVADQHKKNITLERVSLPRTKKYPFNLDSLNPQIITGEISACLLGAYQMHATMYEQLTEEFNVKLSVEVTRVREEKEIRYEELRQRILQQLHANLVSYQQQGPIPYVETYSQTMMMTLLGYYLDDRPEVQVIPALMGVNWGTAKGSAKSIADALQFIHDKRSFQPSDNLPTHLIVPINLGDKSPINLFHEEPQPLLTFQLPGDGAGTIELIEKPIDKDGDCGFNAMGITRKKLIQVLLLAYEKDPEGVSQRLLAEIREAYNHWIQDPQATELEKKYRKKEEELDVAVRLIKKSYDKKHEIQSMERPAFYAWIKDNDERSHQQLSRPIASLKKAESTLFEYYRTDIVVRKYIAAYEQYLWLGIESALIYAQEQSINLYVWQNGDIGKTPSAFHQAVNGAKTIHLYYLPEGSSHFNVLVPPEAQPSPEKILDHHEQWILVGIRYPQQNLQQAEEVLVFDPRGIALPRDIETALKTLFDGASYREISPDFLYNLHSGAWIIEIARRWSYNRLYLPCALNLPLALERHKRVLWKLGAFERPYSEEKAPLTANQHRWFAALVAAVLRDDINFLDTFLDPVSGVEQRRLAHYEKQLASYYRQAELATLANRASSLQMNCLRSYLAQEESNRSITALSSQLKEIAQTIDQIIPSFTLTNEEDVRILAFEFEEDKKQQAQKAQKLQQKINETINSIDTIKQQHTTLRAQQENKIAHFVANGNFEHLPQHLHAINKHDLGSYTQEQELPLSQLRDEAGHSLLDIAFNHQKINAIQWLQAHGDTSQLFQQAVAAIGAGDINFLLLVLHIDEMHPKAGQWRGQQQALLSEIQGILNAQIRGLQSQIDALAVYLFQHKGELEESVLKQLEETLNQELNEAFKFQQDIFQKQKSFLSNEKLEYLKYSLQTHKVVLPKITRSTLQQLQSQKSQQHQQLMAQQKMLLANQQVNGNFIVADLATRAAIVGRLLQESTDSVAKQPNRPSLISFLPFCNSLSINSQDENNQTLLHHAFASKQAEVILFLLEKQPNLEQNCQSEYPNEIKDIEGNTFLHESSYHGQWPVVSNIMHILQFDYPHKKSTHLYDNVGRDLLKSSDATGTTLLHQVLRNIIESPKTRYVIGLGVVLVSAKTTVTHKYFAENSNIIILQTKTGNTTAFYLQEGNIQSTIINAHTEGLKNLHFPSGRRLVLIASNVGRDDIIERHVTTDTLVLQKKNDLSNKFTVYFFKNRKVNEKEVQLSADLLQFPKSGNEPLRIEEETRNNLTIKEQLNARQRHTLINKVALLCGFPEQDSDELPLLHPWHQQSHFVDTIATLCGYTPSLLCHLLQQGASLTAANEVNQDALTYLEQLPLPEQRLACLSLAAQAILTAHPMERGDWSNLECNALTQLCKYAERIYQRQVTLVDGRFSQFRKAGEAPLVMQQQKVIELLIAVFRASRWHNDKVLIEILGKNWSFKGINPGVFEKNLKQLTQKAQKEEGFAYLGQPENTVIVLQEHVTNIEVLEHTLMQKEKALEDKTQDCDAQIKIINKQNKQLELAGNKMRQRDEQIKQLIEEQQKLMKIIEQNQPNGEKIFSADAFPGTPNHSPSAPPANDSENEKQSYRPPTFSLNN